jgi:hypothetical protein
MNIYNSISELPLKIFNKIVETGNLKLLIIEGEYSDLDVIEAWNSINKEFFNEFGISFEEKEQLKAKIRYINHMKKYYLENDAFSKTLANLELQKKELNTKNEKNSYLKICVTISKILEMRIDYSSITVGEFFHYVKLAEEISKSYKTKTT